MTTAPTLQQLIKAESEEEDFELPERFLQEHHPANDNFLKEKIHLERAMVAQQAKFKRRWHLQVIKQTHNGARNKDIAAEMRRSPATISKIINSKDAKNLLHLMNVYATHTRGANVSQRQALLWEVAQNNKADRPSIAVQAISELNKMDFKQQELQLRQQEANQHNHTQPISITINEKHLPRTTLDQ